MNKVIDSTYFESMKKCDNTQLVGQIGKMNIFAISGGRVEYRPTGITLPVARGYWVMIDLSGDDTYTVSRVLKRKGLIIKGTVEGVYCENIGEVAYQASCYASNYEFGMEIAA